MKFVCNNCGFSAEVPDRRSNCPMCASSNVTVSAHTENLVAQEKIPENKPEDDVHTQQTVEAESATKIKQDKNSGGSRKERITLSDEFFDSKAEKEEQEIASILKELDPEAGVVKSAPDMTRWIKTGGIAAAVLMVLAGIIYFAVSGGKEPGVQVVQEENKAEDEVSGAGEPEQTVAEETKPSEEKPVVAKEEPEAEEKPVEKVQEQKIEPVKEVKEEAVVQKMEEPKKQEPVKPKTEVKKQEPVKQTVKKAPEPAKKAPVKQTAPKTGGSEAFNNFVQAGHKALSEKRYTDALHEYKNASRINPGNGPIYKFLGIAYAYLQNQEQACVNYRKYIQLSPNAPDKTQVEAFIKACP
jgi:hypothetical protein